MRLLRKANLCWTGGPARIGLLSQSRPFNLFATADSSNCPGCLTSFLGVPHTYSHRYLNPHEAPYRNGTITNKGAWALAYATRHMHSQSGLHVQGKLGQCPAGHAGVRSNLSQLGMFGKGNFWDRPTRLVWGLSQKFPASPEYSQVKLSRPCQFSGRVR